MLKLYIFFFLSGKLYRDWTSIHQTLGHKFTHVLPVIDLIMTISPSSAEAERGFSQLKLIKTRLRSRLSQNVLNDLLGIKMGSPSIQESDPIDSIHLWNESGDRSRRPMLQDNTEPGLSSSANKYINSVTSQDKPAVSDEGDEDDSESEYDEALSEPAVFKRLENLVAVVGDESDTQ